MRISAQPSDILPSDDDFFRIVIPMILDPEEEDISEDGDWDDEQDAEDKTEEEADETEDSQDTKDEDD